MFIERMKFDEMQKKLAEYEAIHYELQLENETLSDCKDSYDCAKAKFKMDIQYMDNVTEMKVVRKDGKALIELWLKSETLKHLRQLAHKQPEAFLSRDKEIATYIEKLIELLYYEPVRPLVVKSGGKEPGCTNSRWNIL